MVTGAVKWCNTNKGTGSDIPADNGDEEPFHHTAITAHGGNTIDRDVRLALDLKHQDPEGPGVPNVAGI